MNKILAIAIIMILLLSSVFSSAQSFNEIDIESITRIGELASNIIEETDSLDQSQLSSQEAYITGIVRTNAAYVLNDILADAGLLMGIYIIAPESNCSCVLENRDSIFEGYWLEKLDTMNGLEGSFNDAANQLGSSDIQKILQLSISLVKEYKAFIIKYMR